MKKYLYKTKELEYLKFIKNNKFKEIFWNYVCFVIDYWDFYFKFSCESLVADSQNRFDEAIITQIEKINWKYIVEKDFVSVYKNQVVDKLYVLRTFLYFTDYEENIKKFNIFDKIKKLFKKESNSIEELLSNTTWWYSEIICKPGSKESYKISKNYSNLLDVWILLKINNRYLKIFIDNNAFWYWFADKKEEWLCNNLEEFENYELIKL